MQEIFPAGPLRKTQQIMIGWWGLHTGRHKDITSPAQDLEDTHKVLHSKVN